MTITKSCQFAALTVASGAAGLAAYLVPNWKSGYDPCLWTAVATLIVVAILWRLFWLPEFHSRSEQRVLPGCLIGMPVIYVMRCVLFADQALSASWLCDRATGAYRVSAIATLGLRGSGWFLAVGIAGHGFARDLWHFRHSSYNPTGTQLHA